MQYEVIAMPYSEDAKGVLIDTKSTHEDAVKVANEARNSGKWKYVCIRDVPIPMVN